MCAKLERKITAEYESISPALLPIHTRLLDVKRELSGLKSTKPSLQRIGYIQQELQEIDSARLDGKWMDLQGDVVPGQATVLWMLEGVCMLMFCLGCLGKGKKPTNTSKAQITHSECFSDCNQLLSLREPIAGDNPLRTHYEELIAIKMTLEDMLQEVVQDDLSGIPMQHDLLTIQQKLGMIDNLRVDGKFLDPQVTKNPGAPVPEGQAVMHFLLHKAYRLVYRLQAIIPWIEESLLPVLHKLLTLRKCLTELVKWKVELEREESLPYQMKLMSVIRLIPPLPPAKGVGVATPASSAPGSEADVAAGQGPSSASSVQPLEGVERLHALAKEVEGLLRSLMVVPPS
jgi:hypothetical protein